MTQKYSEVGAQEPDLLRGKKFLRVRCDKFAANGVDRNAIKREDTEDMDAFGFVHLSVLLQIVGDPSSGLTVVIGQNYQTITITDE